MYKQLIGVAAAALLSGSAAAAVITANDIADDGFAGGLSFSATGGDLNLKTKHGITGVGVSGGRTDGEIDVNESITASASQASSFVLDSLTLALLFDGPEFNDFEEVASITATSESGDETNVRLVNNYASETDTDLTLFIGVDDRSGLIQTASQATNSAPATATLGDIFGQQSLTSIEFTALDSDNCGVGSCTNQSDYAIESIKTVPGPGALGLILIGLVGLAGAGARRRTHLV